jgi:hypothetical protein
MNLKEPDVLQSIWIIPLKNVHHSHLKKIECKRMEAVAAWPKLIKYEHS